MNTKTKAKSIVAIILVLAMMISAVSCAAQEEKPAVPDVSIESGSDVTVSDTTAGSDTSTASETTAAEPESSAAATEETDAPDETEVTEPAQTESNSETEASTPSGTPDEEDVKPIHTAHNFGDWGVTVSATCAKAGKEERICTVCGKAETRTIAAKGHSYGDWTVTKAATCTASGTRQRVCALCGKAQTETVTASHNWSGWKTTRTESYYWIDEAKELAGKNPAVRSRSCSVCGAEESEEYVVSDEEKNALALAVAKQIVAEVDSKTYDTEMERVQAAATIVSAYSQSCIYLQQTTKPKDYKTAYGVFVAGIYTCAGSTRAMGLVLDCMGFKWEHANENENTHQWCILTMDGRVGFADGQIGFAYYGHHLAEDYISAVW